MFFRKHPARFPGIEATTLVGVGSQIGFVPCFFMFLEGWLDNRIDVSRALGCSGRGWRQVGGVMEADGVRTTEAVAPGERVSDMIWGCACTSQVRRCPAAAGMRLL